MSVKIPKLFNDQYWSHTITKDGISLTGFTGHSSIESCWICCNAYNKRMKVSEKDVAKKFEKYGKGKKEKKGKKVKKK